MSAAQIVVCDDVAAAAAERMAAACEAGGHVCLSGGSTPRAAYELAAAGGADWSGAVLWYGDERCVEPGDERSNHRMAREALAGVDGLDLRRMPGELGPHAGADAYERELRSELGGAVPAFDLALMGLGPDGHTASLFPGSPALDERARACVGVERAGMEPYVPRITLTLPVFRAARELLFLVAGASKAEALRRAFADDPSPETPASLLRAESGRIVVLCDADAAALVQDDR